MKKIILYLFFLFAVYSILNTQNCFGQWVQTNGPNGGDIRCMEIINGNIFAGTWSQGIYSSTDGGNVWNCIAPNINNTNVIVNSGNTIFVGSYLGINISTDNGFTWFSSNNGLNSPVRSICISNLNGYVFAGTQGGVFRSSDNGLNWTAINTGLLGLDIYSLALLGSKIYASDYSTSSGLYVSTNNGDSWALTSLNNSAYTYYLYTIGTNIFAGTYERIYRSTNDGIDWTLLNNGLPAGKYINTFAFSGENIFAGSYMGGVFLSTNNGLLWTEVNNNLYNKYINVLKIKDGELFSATTMGGIYKTSVSANNWISLGIKNTTVKAFAISGNNLIAATRGGKTFISTNNGTDWAWSGDGMTYGQYSYSLIANGNYVFAGSGAAGTFLSTNRGVNWSPSGLFGYSINSFAFRNDILYAATTNGVFRTTNSGVDWYSVINGLDNTDVNSIFSDGDYLYAGTQGGGVFITSDGGASWHQSNGNLGSQFIYNFTSNLNVVYACTGNGIFVTTNAGVLWNSLGLIEQNVQTLLVSGSNLIAGCDNGIYISPNKGINWFQKNQGFAQVPQIYSLYLQDDFVLAGTNEKSVWKRSLSELVGIKTISTEVPSSFSLSQNFPNPFNPTTIIKYQIKENSFVSLKVFNALGREVSTIVNEKQNVGTYSVTFDASSLASGIYFYKLTSVNLSETKKMILIK